MELYYAKIGLDGLVLDVFKVPSIEAVDPETLEVEDVRAIDYLIRLTGHAAWKRTFKDASEYAMFAYRGCIWDTTNQIFCQSESEKPFPSWVMNTTNGMWEAPVALPADASNGIPEGRNHESNPVRYGWDEDAGEWVTAEAQGFAPLPEGAEG
jgi:hypothetical protein